MKTQQNPQLLHLYPRSILQVSKDLVDGQGPQSRNSHCNICTVSFFLQRITFYDKLTNLCIPQTYMFSFRRMRQCIFIQVTQELICGCTNYTWGTFNLVLPITCCQLETHKFGQLQKVTTNSSLFPTGLQTTRN